MIENWAHCSYSSPSIYHFFCLSKVNLVKVFSVQSSNMANIWRMSDCIEGLRLKLIIALIFRFSFFFFFFVSTFFLSLFCMCYLKIGVTVFSGTV